MEKETNYGDFMDTSKRYKNSEGLDRSIWQMVREEPDWAANRVQEGEKAIERVKLLEKAICIYSREELEDFACDKDAISNFLRWAQLEP